MPKYGNGIVLKELTDKQIAALGKMIDDVRSGKITRFGGGTSVYDFKLDRGDAMRRVQEFLEEVKNV